MVIFASLTFDSLGWHVWIILAFALFLVALLLRGIADLGGANNRALHEERAVEATQSWLDGAISGSSVGDLFASPARTIVEQFVQESKRDSMAGRQVDRSSLRDRYEDEIYQIPSMARSIAGLAVYIGLVGTLAGLTAAVVSLQATEMTSFEAWVGSTRSMLFEFGLAFTSALMGVFVTIVLASLLNGYDKRVATIARSVESLCADGVARYLRETAQDDESLPPEAVARRLIEDYRDLSNEWMHRFAEIVGSLERLAFDLSRASEGISNAGQSLNEAAQSVESSAQRTESASATLGSTISEVTGAVGKTADSLSRFEQFVAAWDATPLREANERIARVVPDLQTSVENSLSRQEAMNSATIKEIAGLVQSTNSMIAGSASILAAMDEALRHLVPIAAGAPVAVIQPATNNGDLRLLVDEFRALRTDMRDHARQPVSIESSNGTTTVVNPIPQQAISDISGIASSLERIRFDLGALRNLQQTQVSQAEEGRVSARVGRFLKRLFRRG